MDVLLWSRLKGGTLRRFRNIPCETANQMFVEHKKLMHDPFTTYYRVSLIDPLAGDRVVRDSDWEVFGLGGAAGIEPARRIGDSKLVTRTGDTERGGA